MKIKKSYLKWIFVVLILAGTGCRSSASFNFGAYSEAENFYEKGEYAKAAAKYEEYLRENPAGNMAVISRYYMAKSYEGMGQTDRAREVYNKIIKDSPDLIWAKFAKERLEELKA